jgi:beta-lactamase class A
MYSDLRRARRAKKKFFFYFICILLIFFFSRWIIGKYNASQIISPLADSFETTQNDISTPTTQPTHKPLLGFLSKSKKPEDLRVAVKTLADTKWKNYSVYVVDLNSNFSMSINESSIFDGASVSKIPILVTLYHEAEKGNINFSDTITIQSKDIQDYGTGSIRYDRPGTVYSIKTLARLMIQQSDNTAAYVLANYTLGLPKIQSYIESLGATQTDMEENTTSNKDIALLFGKMFKGEIAKPALTQEMIGFLKDTDFEDRIPAQLPEGTTVYHKIGTGIGAVHDAGVVESGGVKYYIGVFTSNITDEERTAEEIAQVSKLIYEFMK